MTSYLVRPGYRVFSFSLGDGHHRVSVRAPDNCKEGSDELCRQFSSGGGRKASAGINALAESSLAHKVIDYIAESVKK